MLLQTKPSNFKNRFDIVSCFCVKDGKLLFLHRQDHKPQGNLWGIPAGKVDINEDHAQAIERELREETGLIILEADLQYLDKVYSRYPEYDFTFYMYKTVVNKRSSVTVNPNEHKAFRWVKLKELGQLNLMEDIAECVNLYYK